MSEMNWYWVYNSYLDEPERQDESASGWGYSKVYFKSEVDAVIAEKDAEIRRQQRALWLKRADDAAKEVNFWNLENDSYYAIVDFNIRHETIVSYEAPHHRPYKWILIWENIERKCRAMAEEYK